MKSVIIKGILAIIGVLISVAILEGSGSDLAFRAACILTWFLFSVAAVAFCAVVASVPVILMLITTKIWSKFK